MARQMYPICAHQLEAERFVEPPALVPAYLLWRCRRR